MDPWSGVSWSGVPQPEEEEEGESKQNKTVHSRRSLTHSHPIQISHHLFLQLLFGQDQSLFGSVCYPI